MQLSTTVNSAQNKPKCVCTILNDTFGFELYLSTVCPLISKPIGYGTYGGKHSKSIG